jgi:hypothetical protein
MRRLGGELRWWGLFALIPLMVILIALDDASFTQTWHLVLLGVVAVVICVLAAAWVERNRDLVEREGADSLTNYRVLPGTIDATNAGLVTEKPHKTESRMQMFGYDPLDFPPVSHSSSDD